MKNDQLIAQARATAAAHDLAPDFVCAVCEQESNWNPWAMRYEPAFFERYISPLVDSRAVSATEASSRAFSWGLMQVMGQVAREQGFAGAALAELCDPAVGLEIGCGVLARKLAVAKGDVERALLLWNGGSDENYPPQVLARMEKYK